MILSLNTDSYIGYISEMADSSVKEISNLRIRLLNIRELAPNFQFKLQ